MKIKKSIIYIILFLIILICLSIILFKDNSVSKEHTENVSNKETKHLEENSWMKSLIEYYVDGKLDYKLDKLDNMYIDFKEDKIEFCNKDEKNAIVCNSYDYKFGKDTLTVNSLDEGKDVTYTYEFVGENQLILTFDGGAFITKNYYDRVIH